MKTVKVGDFEVSNARPYMLIAGPCQMESLDHARMLAEKIAAAAGAAKRETGPNDDREPDIHLQLTGLIHRMGNAGSRAAQADFGHGVAELEAIFSEIDGLCIGADHLYAELLQHPFPGKVQRTVQRRLTAHGGQQGVGPLLLDDARDGLPADRLNVRTVGHFRIGHDRGRVGVHQDDPIALLPQRLTRLGSGVVELAGLADDDGAGADDEDALDIVTFWHISGSSAP